MDDRVGTLALRVETDLEGREDEVRDVAERFTREVVERVSRLLDERLPGRLVLLRQLPVRWTLSERAATSAAALRDEVARAAEVLLDGLVLPPEDVEPAPDAPAAVFASEAVWIASALQARARGSAAWFHRGALESEPLERLIAAPVLARAVVVALAARDAVIEVLGAAPVTTVTRLADVVCDDAAEEPARDEDAALVLALVERLARWPAVEPALRRLAVHAHAARSMANVPEARPRIAAVARRALAIASPARLQAQVSSPRAEQARATAPLGQLTDHAGLFYLLAPILELGLAEALWQACLPEGTVIANALCALVEGDDPALATIAGEPLEVPGIEAAQATEVSVAALVALVVALPRGGRAELPPAYVQLVEHARGRMLAVGGLDAPFAWFCAPVPRPADVVAALAQLFARWPRHLPIHGAPALVELDRSGRLRHARSTPPPLLLAGGAAAAEVAIGSVVVGTACQLVAARLGDRVETISAWVDRRFARPGRITRDDAAIEVWQPADAVDLEVRAAGIDRDPGFVPWLDRTVRLRFED